MPPPPPAIPCAIDTIANGFGLFRCDDVAAAIQHALIQGGVHGVWIEFTMPQFGGLGTLGNMYADEGRFAGQTFSTNGRHVAIEVGGQVYDSNFPSGKPRTDWLAQMQTRFGSVADALSQGVMVLTETPF